MCPMCGAPVSATATECPNCGEPFLPAREDELEYETEAPEYVEETLVEEQEELEVLAPGPVDVEESEGAVEGEAGAETAEPEICPECGSPMEPDGTCPVCGPPPETITAESSDGCPICGSRAFTVEAGDLVSCADCGNVYIRREFEGAVQNWKWKFWVGLVFIIIGDMGVALGSYVHNVLEWSPLGNLYLGYGWMDQLTGILGIVLFILGLILFAWSFKREREVQCPSCKVIVLESQLQVAEEEEEEEEVPEELAVESALEEIGELAECPHCGAEVSIFDTACPNCGAVFEAVENGDIGDAEDRPIEEGAGPGEKREYLSASEIDEDEIIMESLELEGAPGEPDLNGNGLSALKELEADIEMTLAEDYEATCPSCGAIIGAGLDTCPNCGAHISPEGGE